MDLSLEQCGLSGLLSWWTYRWNLVDYSLGGFSVGTVDLVDYSVGGFIVGTVWTIVWVDLALEQWT